MQEPAGGGAAHGGGRAAGPVALPGLCPGRVGGLLCHILCPQCHQAGHLLGRGKKGQNGPSEGGEGGV